jgi:DNA invertase Pin-like site-specific DNA recombinase
MKVEIIKASASDSIGRKRTRIEKLRVAAYCRVSTDSEEQIKSYNSMVTYYTDLIKNNKDWIFAGVFADRAITGTKIDKREEFQRLIQECMDGHIDMILAKSIPRFARNTLDTLKYVRMLRERNIAVYFEVEKINTLKDGEFLITILSSVAQQEVENTSAYVKKGLKMKMKRGELVGFQGCLGYDYDTVTKSISINEEGASTVRYIFERYVAGAGSTMIARELNEQGIKTIKGNKWTCSSVMGIIHNEKYKGDILLGKTFTVDPISKRRLGNLGEEDRFYIREHHEPIISEEVFEKAQELRMRRSGGKKKATLGNREKFSRQYAFSCMIECGFCGSYLSRRRWHSGTNHEKTIWQCVKATKGGKRFCPDSKGITEDVIEKAFVESYRMLGTDNNDILKEFLERIEKTLNENSIEETLFKMHKKADKIQGKRKKLLDNFLNGAVTQDLYEEMDLGLERKLSDINANLQMLESQLDDEASLKKRIQEFKTVLSKNQVLEEFDRGIFESIVEKVIVGGYDEDGNKDPYKITFIYKTGFRSDFHNAKEQFGKLTDKGSTLEKTCSFTPYEVEDMCSDNSDDKCGDYSGSTSGRCLKIIDRQ